jgi:DNA-directed RNA polymerase subunit RPC12/RpoP
MQNSRRQFLKSAGLSVAAGAALVFGASGCASLVSPTVADSKAQAWHCGNCGHLLRSDKDLTGTRCPRCFRKGFLKRITEEEMQAYLKNA